MKKITDTASMLAATVVSVPQWAADIHAYYAATGQYRMDDVLRILGNPSETVEGPRNTGDCMANFFSAES